MFGLSIEHIILLFAVILIFGPRKLPELGSSIGKAVRNFKEGLAGPQPPPSQNQTNQTAYPNALHSPAQNIIQAPAQAPAQTSVSDNAVGDKAIVIDVAASSSASRGASESAPYVSERSLNRDSHSHPSA